MTLLADLLFLLLLVLGASAVVLLRRSLPLLGAALVLAPIPAVLAGYLLGGPGTGLTGQEGPATSPWLLAAACYLAVWVGAGTGLLVASFANRTGAAEDSSSSGRRTRGEPEAGSERPRRRRAMGAPPAPRRSRESRPA